MEDSPWLSIPADDYEAHMGAIGQSAALRQVFGRVYTTYRPRRLAVLGCTDGADFDLVDFTHTEFALGLDINPHYIERASARHRATDARLKFVCGDVVDVDIPGGPFDLIHAALLLEYVDPGMILRQIGGWLSPAGVCSVVTQDPHDRLGAVSNTPYSSLEVLADRMTLRSAAEVADFARSSGLQLFEQEPIALPGGKTFTLSIVQLPRELDIRPAVESDLAGVTQCLAETFEPYRARYTPEAFQDTVLTLESAKHRLREMTILVAEDTSREVVGTISYQAMARGEGHLRGMAVVPRFQGGGLARRLLETAERDLRALGCTRVTLDTTLPLERAIRFYTSRGYRPTGTVTDFFGMLLYEYEKPLTKSTK